jgi:hypothetical protein
MVAWFWDWLPFNIVVGFSRVMDKQNDVACSAYSTSASYHKSIGFLAHSYITGESRYLTIASQYAAFTYFLKGC